MDALLDEVDSLEAILMDDVRITRNSQSGLPELIETTIFPVVGEESDQQYVCVTLQVFPQAHYPDESPQFKLVRPRGLDDVRLEAIRSACLEKLQSLKGCPVVFDLIETVRELLTGSNLPSGQCVVCLYGFCDGDEFTRTECFHFLHSYCLGRHLNAMRRNYQEEYDKLPGWLQKKADPFQAVCPVCREGIKDEADGLKCAMPPAELQNAPDFQLTVELREMQQRMSALFLQQKERGGIIDVEAEQGTVISIETEQELRRRLARKSHAEATPTVANAAASVENVEKRDNAASKPSGSRCTSKAQNNVEQQEQPEESDSHRRHYRGGRRHQYHHQHQHRERHRERYVYNHMSSQEPKAAATPSEGNGGKQAKAQAIGVSHNR